jgi:TIR domain
MGQAMPHQIFMSYCREDARVAEAVYAAAAARNVSVWYDKLIPGGLDWRDSIVDAIEGCEIVLILFSEESNKSKQLIKELAIADSLSKLVVPVLIENTQPRGAYLYEMAARNWINLYPDPVLRVATLVDSLALQLTARPENPAATVLPSASARVTEINDVQPAVPAVPVLPVPKPIASTGKQATSTVEPVNVAPSTSMSASSLPIKRRDIYVLGSLLILFFVVGAYNVESGSAAFNMFLLLAYMIVVAVRTARSNVSVPASRSFAMYLCIALLVIPFGLGIDWVTGKQELTNFGLTGGVMIMATLTAAGVSAFQFVLRKILQQNIFKKHLGNPLPVQTTPT